MSAQLEQIIQYFRDKPVEEIATELAAFLGEGFFLYLLKCFVEEKKLNG